MAWYDDVIAVHTAVSDSVSHIQRMKSDRYFVWEEDDKTDLVADGEHSETGREIVTDLFTHIEFDPWVESFEIELNKNGYPWSYDFVEYEEDTGLFHHQWRWSIYG